MMEQQATGKCQYKVATKMMMIKCWFNNHHQ